MILRIADKYAADGETVCIPYSWLNDKAVHLYLASNLWDELQVDISPDIPVGVMQYVSMKCKSVKVNLPRRKLESGELTVLCDLYPDKAGALRKANMLGKDLNTLLC